MPAICSLKRRPVSDRALFRVIQADPSLSRLEARLIAARLDAGKDDRLMGAKTLPDLLAVGMRDLSKGATRISHAIDKSERIVVIADYDCDGATACAVSVAGLKAMGAAIGYVVPNRMVHGYGISPSVVDLARDAFPDARVLVTVDNGILGHSGIAYAARLGMDVVVTDHHLPGETLPDALAVIDPSCADCPSQLTRLAGVGVAFWLVAAVKRLRQAAGHETPSLNFLLPYVAIGTVADMVKLDAPNRRLVAVGMDRMRLGQAPLGIAALIREAGVAPAYLTTQDIGFSMAPRINAAGRLDSMAEGIDLLLADDEKTARQLAKLLTETNECRKQLQREAVNDVAIDQHALPAEAKSLVRASVDWHPGIVGLVASRLKDACNMPVFAFSLADGTAKGSGRSIPGFHLKDALEEVARRAPGVLIKFGGHAMAAGATLASPQALNAFERVFAEMAAERVTLEMLQKTVWTDGAFPELNMEDAVRILRHPWGQGFDAPTFDDEAELLSVAPLGDKGLHWRIRARIGGQSEATTVVLFNQPEPPARQLHLHLTPSFNSWKGNTAVQWQGQML